MLLTCKEELSYHMSCIVVNHKNLKHINGINSIFRIFFPFL